MRLRGLVSFLVVLALIGVGGYYARQRFARASAPAGPVYATATATTGTMVADVTGFGPLQPEYLAPLQATASGTVDQVFVTQGQVVHKGELLAKLSNPQLGAQIQQDQVNLDKDLQALADALGVPVSQALSAAATTSGIAVDAPQTGRVVNLKVAVGDKVPAGSVLATIVDDQQVVIDLNLVPFDDQHVVVGDPVTVRFSAFAGSVQGQLTSIASNPVPSATGFVYPATVTLTNPGLLVPGLKGQLTIEHQGVPYPVPQEVSISGYGQSTDVTSPVDGTVQTLAVQANGWVQQGQTLLTLGGASTLAAIRQARAAVDQAESTLTQDQQDLASLTLTSNLDGTVGYLFLQPGQHVNAGQNMGSVFNAQSMNLTIQVSELQVANVHTGQDVLVTTPGLPGKTFHGSVTSVDTMGTQQNGLSTFGVHIGVAATSGLRPGMTADARIVVATVPNALMVPVEAVLQQDTGTEVEVLRDGRPETVPVQVGLVNDQYAQITSGLSAGVTVITGMAAPAAAAAASAATGNGSVVPSGSVNRGLPATGTTAGGGGVVKSVGPMRVQGAAAVTTARAAVGGKA